MDGDSTMDLLISTEIGTIIKLDLGNLMVRCGLEMKIFTI